MRGKSPIDPVRIGPRLIGPGCPIYIVAEMSANHNGDFQKALRLLRAAKEAGADAVKLQTYTPDTLTIDCDKPPFLIKGTLWDKRRLYDLYGEAYTPWEWHPKLKAEANRLGLDLFSTPFDETSVEFLERLKMPAHKVASFELVDLPLLRKVGATGKPVIMSTGMATLAEIRESASVLRRAGCGGLILLKCTSAYPAAPEEMNLRTIGDLSRRLQVPVGLSDHTLGTAVPVAAVPLGICMIEKHFTLDRSAPGPDSAFSLEPAEFRAMVDAVRTAEKALGGIRYGPSLSERSSLAFRRSLFIVKDVARGEVIGKDHVRSIRPGHGLHPRHLDDVIGRRARSKIERGTPLKWALLARPSRATRG